MGALQAVHVADYHKLFLVSAHYHLINLIVTWLCLPAHPLAPPSSTRQLHNPSAPQWINVNCNTFYLLCVAETWNQLHILLWSIVQTGYPHWPASITWRSWVPLLAFRDKKVVLRAFAHTESVLCFVARSFCLKTLTLSFLRLAHA